MNELQNRDLQSADIRRHVARIQQKRQYRGHAVLALLVILGITVVTLQSKKAGSASSSLFPRDLDSISPYAKKKCENIYAHSDQCAFVLKHCEESEVGMLHYLKFYFCTLGNVRPIAFFLMIVWLSLLFSAIGIAASDFFCPNLATLSQALKMSESMAGVTFLALGNGSPDLFSTFAAMRVGSGSLAIGELIGAAFFITSVVSGSMAIVNPFKVSHKSFLRDVTFFAGAVGFSVGLLADGKINTWETSFMIAYYIVYVFVVVMATWYWGKRSRRRRQESRARRHFQRPEEESVEVEDDEASTARESTALMGDVRDLEENAVDEENEAMEQHYAAIQHRMSLVRPSIDGTRMPSHHNHSNIRPSLFGALEFRSLSSKLASASAMPHRHDRRHSTAQTSITPTGHTLHRNFSDPFQQSQSPPAGSRTAPPIQAPWRTSDGQYLQAHPDADYFTYPNASTIQRSVSPLTQTPIPEEEDDDDDDNGKSSTFLLSPQQNDDVNVKSSTFLLPPQQVYGTQKTSPPPPLHLDTSDVTLVQSPVLHARERSRSGSTSPLGFRDVQEDGSLNSPIRHVRYRWWPYFLLPDPHFLYASLFPTLNDFRSKTWLQRILSIIALPAVFCLTITLPVVDTEQSEVEGEIKLPSDSPTTLVSPLPDGASELFHPLADEDAMVPRSWNRWLTGVQCIFAPLIITFIFFEDNELLLPMLYALVSGLIALALLLTFSSPNKPPKWHKALCAVGFLVAIGWISTIADEVVGVLRAIGAILGVSEAILGVTVFAVGNSLSDFVADVTVAKMGFPMMAMSACFGGPMLNILLGVGVSGLIMNLSDGEYHVHISPTLLVSTISLFVTLTSMLIVVPLSKWRMTRTFGICLVVFFTLSTIASVIVEIVW